MPDADYKALVEKSRKLDLVSNFFKDGVVGVYGPIEADVRPGLPERCFLSPDSGSQPASCR